MATILGLALKINADASAVPAALTPVERALRQLDTEAAKVTGVFDKFSQSSAAAAEVQQRLEAEIAALTGALKDGAIDGPRFAEGFAAIRAEAAKLSAAFEEGARIQKQYGDQTKAVADEINRAIELQKLGAVDQQAVNALAIEKLGLDKQAAASAKARADAVASAEREQAEAYAQARRIEEQAAAQAGRERVSLENEALAVRQRNLTAQERFDQAIARLNLLEQAGVLQKEDYNRELQRQSELFAKATIEAGKTGTAINAAGKGGTLQFNELSGILSAIPGPLGNVAGRFSGLASAGEGLSRVFSGGLSAGISGVGASVAALVNPFTLAVAGVAGFGAAALAVTQGLIALEERVEQLGNTADKLGVSFEFIQTLEEAAERSGTSIDAVSAAFGRLQKSVLGVDEESKAAQKALEEIGVTAQELQQLSPEEQYQRIGVALAGIEDPARRTATATALFGRAGADLIPFFNNIGGAAADMERFGRALTEIDRRRVDDFGAGLDTLRLATQGLGQSLLLPFAGLGEGIARSFAEITAGITAIIDPIGQVLEPVLTQIGRVIQLIGTGLGNLGRIIGAVFEPFATVVQTVSQALEPLYEGLFGFLAGFSDASVQVTEFLVSFTPIGAIAANAAALGDTLSRVVTIVTTAFSRIGEAIGNTLGQAVEWVSRGVSAFAEFTGLGPTLEAIGSTISSVFGAVSSVFQTIASAIGGTVGRLLTIAENFLGIERSAEAASAGVDQVAESTVQLTEEQKRAAAEVQKAVENSSGVLDTAIKKAGEFGQAGFDAAFQFQEALADLQEQADAGELNAEQYSRGVALATAEFDKQIGRLQQIQNETRKAAEEAQKRIDADRQVTDALLEQARVNREFGGDASRAKAADAVLAAEREIARIKSQVETARASGDSQAVTNGEERIRQLQQIQTQQAAIADGSAKAAADEARRVEDQKKRVDTLIAASDTRSELEQQLIDVQEQQKLTLDQLIVARQQFNADQANAAAGRLAQLDQLQAKLEEQQQAVEQGFGQGFAQAFQETDRGIDALIVKAEEFGNVGAVAAQQLEQGIAQAQAQVRDGILTRDTYEREVAQQRDIFQQRLNAAQRVEEFLRQNLDERQKAELDATAKLEERKKQAAKNVEAIERRIADEKRRNEEARERGDLRTARAGAARIRQLEQAQRVEQQIVGGRLQAERLQREQLSGNVDNSLSQFQSFVARSNDLFQRAVQNTYAGANAALEQANQAAAEQARKLEQLLTPGPRAVQVGDVRTAEGANVLTSLAAEAQDPALIQARLQTKLLQQIAQGITGAAANYFNQPVAIVGEAMVG